MVLFPPPFYFAFDISNLLSYIQNNFSYELTRPIMGTIFLVLVHTEKLTPKGPISEKLVSSDISHVALASVLLGENPSEEVDDYDNY